MTHDELASLGKDERASAIEAMEAEVVYNRQRWTSPTIASALRGFEERYGMSTAEMLARFSAGTLKDEDEVSSWLFWARVASDEKVGS